MNHLSTSLLAAVALAFSASAGAETYTFGAGDINLNNWENPFDASEISSGFRIGAPISDYWAEATPPAPGEIGFTGFGATGYNWTDSTIVFGFAASSDKTYTVDWANSWLDLNGTQTSLASFNPTNASAALAANAWGGGGLNPETTWYFDVPADVFSIAGGQIAYSVTSVPEPEAYAMFLAGLGLAGAIVRRRARK
jgi:hypothetical protein